MAAELPVAPARVLLTADTVGGVWTYALELATQLAAQGTQVHLATMGAPVSAQQRLQARRVTGLQLHESGYRLEWMPDPWRDVEQASAWLLRLERTLRPEVVHLNQFAFGALPFEAPALLVAHSCVLSWWRAVHGTAAPPAWDRYRDTVAAGLSGAACVAAPTRAMADTLARNYAAGIRAVVLPNGRDAAGFAPAAKRPVILAAGRLWDEAKNLAALEAVAPCLPWPVQVAGATTGPDGRERHPRAVRALGVLAPPVLAREMARAAIYALPARYEPFGLSVLEAALSGCALVLGDLPSLRETWGPAALYVPPDDRRALREVLRALCADTPQRERLAAAAMARARRFSATRMAQATLSAYAGLRAPQGPSPTTQEPACA